MNHRETRLSYRQASARHFWDTVDVPHAILATGTLVCLTPLAIEVVNDIKEVVEKLIENHYGVTVDGMNKLVQFLPPEAYPNA